MCGGVVFHSSARSHHILLSDGETEEERPNISSSSWINMPSWEPAVHFHFTGKGKGFFMRLLSLFLRPECEFPSKTVTQEKFPQAGQESESLLGMEVPVQILCILPSLP